MIIMTPLNGVLMKKLFGYQKQIMGLRDQRMKILNEALTGIRVIKFFAWEDSFTAKIDEYR